MIREFDGGEQFASDCVIRHPVSLRRVCTDFGGNPRLSAQFLFLAAPETGNFAPYGEDFGIWSLFRISLVPRDTQYKTARESARRLSLSR